MFYILLLVMSRLNKTDFAIFFFDVVLAFKGLINQKLKLCRMFYLDLNVCILFLDFQFFNFLQRYALFWHFSFDRES